MDQSQPGNEPSRIVPSKKIKHSSPLAEEKKDPELSSIKVAEERDDSRPREIRALGVKSRHEDEWSRTPNTTGQGAIHVKTFHCKVTDDGLGYMDRQINEWLDAHPQYEVKFVQTALGTFTGKVKEPHVICQVWV